MPYTDGQDVCVCVNPEGSWIEQVRRELLMQEILLVLNKIDGTNDEWIRAEIQRLMDASS